MLTVGGALTTAFLFAVIQEVWPLDRKRRRPEARG
jgi:hypothetical protein